jgi:hypothetical protein
LQTISKIGLEKIKSICFTLKYTKLEIIFDKKKKEPYTKKRYY